MFVVVRICNSVVHDCRINGSKPVKWRDWLVHEVVLNERRLTSRS